MRNRMKTLLIILIAASFASGCLKNGAREDNLQMASETEAVTSESASVRQIVYMYPWYGTIPSGTVDVQKAINEITIPKINTEVILQPVSASSYPQQLSLAIAGHEKLDLITVPNDFLKLLSQHKLMDVTDLMQSRGQGILDAVGIFIDGTVRNGRIYGVTTMGGKAMSPHFLMRSDLLEETGIDSSQIVPVDNIMDMDKNLDVVERIFDRVRELHPDISMFVNGMGETKLDELIDYDTMGDCLGVLMGGDHEVVNLYETPEFRKTVEIAIRWHEKGYMMKDAAMNTSTSVSILLAGNAFCDLPTTQQGVVAQYKQSTGYDFTAVQMRTPLLFTGMNVVTVNALPLTCTEPEAAMDFLNLMYTDKDIVNLLAYGVEGKHYRFMPDGTVAYPEGITASNSDYPCVQTWLFGNSLLDYPKVGNVPDLYEIQAQAAHTARRSRAFGFIYDDTSVKAEVAACQKIVEEYKDGLLSGSLDIEKLDEFNAKLKDAKIGHIIKEKQRQLEAWSKQSSN